MSILTRVDVCLVCAYICCFHVAAVQGTSQECDDEVCLLQNLVRKPSVLPSESGVDETNANFLQMTSHIDDAMKEAALEAMKDLQKFCTWTESKTTGKANTRFFKLKSNIVADKLMTGSGHCENGVLFRIYGKVPGSSTRSMVEKDNTMAECEKACNRPTGVQELAKGGAGKPFYQCLAVGVLGAGKKTKGTGCWALTGKSDSAFPTFKEEAIKLGSTKDCFTDFTKGKKDSDKVAYGAGVVKYQVCAPTLDEIASLVAPGVKNRDLGYLKTYLNVGGILKNGLTANGVTLDKVRFENGDLVYNLVGLGTDSFASNEKKDSFALKVKHYVQGKMKTRKQNVAVVQVVAG